MTFETDSVVYSGLESEIMLIPEEETTLVLSVAQGVLNVPNIGNAERELGVRFEVKPADYLFNYTGKISGSTTVNQNIGYTKAGLATELKPTDGDWIEFDQAGYDNIATKNGVLTSNTTNTNTHYAAQRMVFDLSTIAAGDVDLIKNNTRSLTFNITSYGHGKNGSADDWQNEVLLWNRSTNQYDSLGYTGVQFSRTSEAYKEDGTVVPANQPRFELGRFHNLLTANQADVEDGTEGFTNISSSITKDISKAWHGIASLKVVTKGEMLSEGAYTNYTSVLIKPSKSYTANVRVNGESGSVKVMLRFLNSSVVSVGEWYSSEIQLNSDWQKVTVTATAPEDAMYASIMIRTIGTQATTFYIDGLQLNEGDPIDWQPGGTGKATMVEEGTTNLIPVDKQKFEGWSTYLGSTVTLTQNQSVPEWGATDATRIQTSGGTDVLKYLIAACVGASGQYYSENVWIKNIGSADLRVYSNQGSKSYTVLAGKQIHVKLEGILGNGVGNVQMQFRAPTAEDSLDFIAWRPQVEQKAYVTSFTPAERKPESLKIPLDGMQCLLDKGTIAIRVNVNDASKRQVASVYSSILNMRIASVNGISLNHSAGSPAWNLNFCANSIHANGYTADSYTPNGWHDFVVRWDKTQSKAQLWIDGVQRIDLDNPKFATVLASHLYLGSNLNVNNELDTTLCDLHISKEYWSDEKIATRATATTWDTRDADTLYISSLSGDFATPCPFNKTLTANLGNYVDDNLDTNILVKSRYPSDGTTESGVYTDYASMTANAECAIDPKVTIKDQSVQYIGELQTDQSITVSDEGLLTGNAPLTTSNLIKNPVFLYSESNWNKVSTPIISRDKHYLGGKSALVNSIAYYTQTLNITAGKPYSFAAEFMGTEDNAVGKLEIEWSTGAKSSVTVTTSASEWQRCELDNQIAPTGATTVTVKVMGNSATSVYADAVQCTQTRISPTFALEDCSRILQNDIITLPANCNVQVQATSTDNGAGADTFTTYLNYIKPVDSGTIQGFVENFSIVERISHKTIPGGLNSLYPKGFIPQSSDITFDIDRLWFNPDMVNYLNPSITYTLKYKADTTNKKGLPQSETRYLSGCVFTDLGFTSPEEDLCKERMSGKALRHFSV